MPYYGGIDFRAINDQGDIAATVTRVPSDDKKYDRDGVAAALAPHDGGDPIYTCDFIGKHSNLLPVGIDGTGNVFMRDDQKYGTSYILRAKGRRYKLNELCEPRRPGLTAFGVSESGFVVGRYSTLDDGRGFILTPLK